VKIGRQFASGGQWDILKSPERQRRDKNQFLENEIEFLEVP
jgi:hypothetical protein